MKSGMLSEDQVTKLSIFVWGMVEKINEDEESGKNVLGHNDNIEMLPDLNYEMTKYMRKVGFYSIWEKFLGSNI